MESLIIDIIHLPARLNELEGGSLYELVKATGYFYESDMVSKFGIIAELDNYPDCMGHWEALSATNKADAGWYLTLEENGKYAIGYYSPLERSKIMDTTDRTKACAMYIKLVIEEARNLAVANGDL